MTNEELKKKICDIIAPYVSAYGDDERIADALIAAGLGFKDKHRVFVQNAPLLPYNDDDVYFVPNTQPKITQLYGDEEVEQIVKERDEYKHRAERAERQARKACEVVFSEEIDNEPWDDMLYIYKDECGIDELGITSDMLYNYLKEQAEKELAEERKDER